MKIEELSSGAQALAHALENAAQSAAQHRGVGYATIHEDMVGGVASLDGAIAELAAAGVNVRVSAGERDRFITIPGVRLTRSKA